MKYNPMGINRGLCSLENSKFERNIRNPQNSKFERNTRYPVVILQNYHM